MTEQLAADTDEMRRKVPTMQQAADLARSIGRRLTDGIAANEPLADWETDEITKNYLPSHKDIKDFVGQVFTLLPPAVGGDSDEAMLLSQLLQKVEEQNEQEADKPVTSVSKH